MFDFRILIIIIVLAWVGMFTYAGSLADKDEQTEFEHYCEMVKAKAWPDYKNAGENCK